jgi:hypothetical protein
MKKNTPSLSIQIVNTSIIKKKKEILLSEVIFYCRNGNSNKNHNFSSSNSRISIDNNANLRDIGSVCRARVVLQFAAQSARRLSLLQGSRRRCKQRAASSLAGESSSFSLSLSRRRRRHTQQAAH